MSTSHKIILPPLIVITPFTVFLNHNSYCATCPETWISLAAMLAISLVCSVTMLLGGFVVSALIIASLVTAFVDLQFTPSNWADWPNEWAAVLLFVYLQILCLGCVLKEKFYTTVAVVFATFFLISASQYALSRTKGAPLFKFQPAKPGAPPRIIHLILDEHVGIEGIPIDLEGGASTKDLIVDFYSRNGFRLFGGAFSRHFYTILSLPYMLNLGTETRFNTKISTIHYQFSNNAYFDILSKKTYEVAVFSSAYIDLCSSPSVASCLHHSGTLRTLASLDLSTRGKIRVLLSRYINQSVVLSFVLRKFVAKLGSTGALELERTRLDSLNSLMNLTPLWNNILSLPHGTAFLAHLFLPHAPYVAQADCTVRPPQRDYLWESRYSFSLSRNTIESRKFRYRLYFDQLQCLYAKLDELFERMRAAGIYDDSIILIHSDHGSRITMFEPVSANHEALTQRDLIDGFSTLFAVKLPGRQGGYDPFPRPLEQLLSEFLVETGLSPTNILPEKSDPYVFLVPNPGQEFVRVPYRPASNHTLNAP